MPILKSGISFGAIAPLSYIFRINLCNMLFRCGCQSNVWGMGSAYCNVHMANMAHCPWCSHGWWGHDIPTIGIILAQAIILFLPMKLSIRNRILLSVAAFFVVGGVIGILFGVFSGYPTFLGFHIS